MKMRNLLKSILLLTTVVMLTFTSCKKTEKADNPNPIPTDRRGIFICNEGPFMGGTGTLSFLERETGEITNSIYEQINGMPLGNIVQSMEIANDKGFIVVNNANKIEVINLITFKREATINQLTLPRFFCQVDDRRAYVTCWDNTIAVINLLTLTVDKHIAVNNGPERLIKAGDRVFVLNQGGFDIDSTISVINITNDQVIRNLQVYPKPTGAVVDKEGKLWVMCSGKGYNGWPAAGDTEGHLLRIDPLTLTIMKDIPFPDNANHPEKLVINKTGDKLYYLYKNGVYEHSTGEIKLNPQALINHNGYLYAIGLDTITDYLYLSDPVDYVQNGWVFRFQASSGLPVDSFAAGIIPTYFCFH